MNHSPKTALALAAIAICALAFTAKAELITDNFDTDHVYGTSDVSGTIWSGILFNGGTSPTQNAVLSQALATSGHLTLGSSNGNWENVQDDGYFLYLNVSGDFTATMQVIGMQINDFNTAGLMARNPDASGGESWFQTLVFPRFNVGQHMRYVVGGVQTDGSNAGTNTSSGWIQLVRTGDQFQSLYSADGISYSVIGSATLANMPSTLQLGIFQATFSGATGAVDFDNFSVNVASIPEPAVSILLVGGLGISLLAHRRRRAKN